MTMDIVSVPNYPSTVFKVEKMTDSVDIKACYLNCSSHIKWNKIFLHLCGPKEQTKLLLPLAQMPFVISVFCDIILKTF